MFIDLRAGYFICYGTVKISSTFSWRFPLGLQAGVGILLAVGTPFFPHSPHWLRHAGRHTEADMAGTKLGMTVVEAKHDEINVTTRDDSGPGANTVRADTTKKSDNEFWTVAKLLWSKDIRFRTFFGVFLMAMQQVGVHTLNVTHDATVPFCITWLTFN